MCPCTYCTYVMMLRWACFISESISFVQGPPIWKIKLSYKFFLFVVDVWSYLSVFPFFFFSFFRNIPGLYRRKKKEIENEGKQKQKEQQPTVVTYTCKIWSVFDVLFDISYTETRLFTLPPPFFIGVPLLRTSFFFLLPFFSIISLLLLYPYIHLSVSVFYTYVRHKLCIRTMFLLYRHI